MTIIEIRPFRNGWKVFEAPGVEPRVSRWNQWMAKRGSLGQVSARKPEIWTEET
jgi:hypothetical protein